MPPTVIVHIAAGGMGLLSGAAALAFRKGDGLHRAAGTVFFVAMLIMSAIGAGMAALKPDRITTFVGIITFYLVATSWVTVRRPPGEIGRFETGGFFVALGIMAADLIFGWQGLTSPHGRIDGAPYQTAFVFAAVAAIAAVSDLTVIRRLGVSGAPRIARHLWRMCVALLIAALSFFLGQQKVMPPSIRGSPILFMPVLAPLVLMVFWLLRVRFTKAFRSIPVAAWPSGRVGRDTDTLIRGDR